jgi:hypothetical protein
MPFDFVPLIGSDVSPRIAGLLDHYVRSSSRALGSISGRRIKSRVSLLKQPLCLHNPCCGFMFAAEAWDRPELTTCCRHLDIEGAIALRR